MYYKIKLIDIYIIVAYTDKILLNTYEFIFTYQLFTNIFYIYLVIFTLSNNLFVFLLIVLVCLIGIYAYLCHIELYKICAIYMQLSRLKLLEYIYKEREKEIKYSN